MSKLSVAEYGWTAVPRNRSNVPSEAQARDQARDVPVEFDIIWPKTPVVEKAQTYAKEHLPLETYLHSLRVYCYGHTIVQQQFPSWIEGVEAQFFETWALTCLFHDIASTEPRRDETHLSFEFHGGFIALQELQRCGAPRAQAESVCEAIIRHQDPGESGTISRMGQVVQLATEFDNMGWQPYLVNAAVIPRVVQQFPRHQWSSCFAATIEAEIAAKPWCHTTAIDGFSEAVAGNKLMAPFE